MPRYTVTVVDTTQIQPYVFGSNRLQENIGASELVRLATGEWAWQAVADVAVKNNVRDPNFRIDSAAGEKAAEIIYSGGGNIVIIFSAAELAREFTGKLTRKVLREAPGLALVIAHDDDFVWSDTERPLAQIVTDLLGKKLAARKAARLPSQPQLGVSVTAVCESTGLPASHTNDDEFSPSAESKPTRLKLSDDEQTRLISREVACKLWARDLANRRLKGEFARELSGWYDFPSDMDNLGRVKGEESYVAVVHADGNGMGKRIQQIADKYPRSDQNREYIQELRSFSSKVDDAAKASIRHIVRLLTERITWEQGQEFVARSVPMVGTYLPFRPLVFGGDDVTFVCNGHLGLSLAVEYLKEYEKQTQKLLNETLTASAGITIVKMHYPFARAYQLSEKLAGNAKKFGRERASGAVLPAALDWHIASTGLSGALKEIRRREYESHDGTRTLLLRPVTLHDMANRQDGRVWGRKDEKLDREQGIELLVRTFQGEDWAGRRNKVKTLRDIMREGLSGQTQKIENLLQSHDLHLPEIVHKTGLYQKNGWEAGRCGYFDAIELSDYYLHLPLPAKEAK